MAGAAAAAAADVASGISSRPAAPRAPSSTRRARSMVRAAVYVERGEKAYTVQKSEEIFNATTLFGGTGAASVAQLLDGCPNDGRRPQEMLRCVHVGLLCVQEDPHLRPPMASVVIMLSSRSITLSAPAALIDLRGSQPCGHGSRRARAKHGTRGFVGGIAGAVCQLIKLPSLSWSRVDAHGSAICEDDADQW
ncbi:hypothetical protein ACP70R_039705 [Stipagrostis hirtigluma subsp. patula]